MKTRLLNLLRSVFKIRPLERWLAARCAGKEIGATLATKLPPNHYQYPQGSRRRVTRGGLRFELDLSDLVDWWIFFGFTDPAREDLYGLLRPGACVLDVGANAGEVTLNAARRVGPAGRVVSFEPDPENHRRLRRNLQLNDLPQVTLVQRGLGDAPGTFLLAVVDETNRGMNRIRAPEGEGGAGVEVEVTTLDAFLEGHEFPRVDLVKIDVEGFEAKVLAGARRLLQRDRPTLFLELGDGNLREQGSSAGEVVSALRAMGYRIRRAGGEAPLGEEAELDGCHFDIVAIHEDPGRDEPARS